MDSGTTPLPPASEPQQKRARGGLLALVGGLAFLLGVSLSQSGTRSEEAATDRNAIADQVKRIDLLAGQVGALEGQLTSVDSRVSDVEVKQSASSFESATFDPSAPTAYSRIDTHGGTFLVSVDHVTPYLDGFQVTCSFGNPSSATYNGFTLHAKWGPRHDRKKYATYDAWQATLKEKDLSLTNSLRPGSWNSVSFVVSPAKADEFGYLELSMATSNVSLIK